MYNNKNNNHKNIDSLIGSDNESIIYIYQSSLKK